MNWPNNEDDYEMPGRSARSLLDEALDKLVSLKIERTQLEARVKVIIREVAELQPQLKQYFDLNPERQSVTINGYTVKMEHNIWAKSKTEKEEGCAALKRAGLSQFVSETFNLNTISAYVRELAEKQEPGNPVELPAELAEVFDVVETDEVHARKAQRARRRTTETKDTETEIEDEAQWDQQRIKSLLAEN
jgi:hypothetical protein